MTCKRTRFRVFTNQRTNIRMNESHVGHLLMYWAMHTHGMLHPPLQGNVHSILPPWTSTALQQKSALVLLQESLSAEKQSTI